jgi:uroporphyrinogen-III synthase
MEIGNSAAAESSATQNCAGPLTGRRIVVPESRQLDLFADMLERQGAAVLRCPLMSVCPLEDTSEVDAWLRRLAAGDHDLLAFYTGEGVTHLATRAEQIGIVREFLSALAPTQTVVRGPKPGAALRKLGLRPDLLAGDPTTSGLLACLAEMETKGRSLGVQVYPGWPEKVLREAFANMGAEFDPVLPYRYVEDQPSDDVASVIQAMGAGTIDLIAFTSQLQVHRLKRVALRSNLDDELKLGFDRTMIASVGPVTTGAVEKLGGKVAIQPLANFHLKPFVAQIVEALGRT